MSTTDPANRRESLRRRLAELEGELAEVQNALVSLGAGEPLPGLYLLAEAAGCRALVAAAMVQEIVRLVAFAPVPASRPEVLGSFLWRGQPVVAIDLASFLGVSREPSLDAHVVIVGGSRSCGIVVDAVRTLVESPVIVEGGGEGSLADWSKSGIAAGFCRVGAEVLPLVSIQALARVAGESG